MNELLNFLIDPLSYPFMIRGLIAVIIVGVVCAIVCCVGWPSLATLSLMRSYPGWQ
jgi:hypothetical protein